MRRLVALALLACLLVVAPCPRAQAKDDGPREVAPAADGKDELSTWKSADGLAYNYRLPRLDREHTPWTMTMILHGSNLSRGWGFANHDGKTFRPHDVVVAPDGTTPNGNGGFNFLGEAKDVKRLAALIAELKKALPIERVLLYGHSQGSFFALHYAGAEPDDVNGVVAHASGLWTWSATGPRGHHQAICLMHGTRDPVVPYGQSVGAYEALKKARYPLLRLRSLEGWNHWPAEHNGPVPHTSQQLAWCDGMTSTDPERLERVLELLGDMNDPGQHDVAALHAVAQRIAGLEDLPADLRRRGTDLAAAAETVAGLHLAAIGDIPDGLEPDGKPWMGHLGVFLRQYAGVPACEACRERLAKDLEKLDKRMGKGFDAWWRARKKDDVPDAFEAGLEILGAGFLTVPGTDPDIRALMDDWADHAKQHKLPRKATRAWKDLADALDKGLKDGWKDFEKTNRRFRG